MRNRILGGTIHYELAFPFPSNSDWLLERALREAALADISPGCPRPDGTIGIQLTVQNS